MKQLTIKGNSAFSILTLSVILVFTSCTGTSQELETTKKEDVVKAQNDLELAQAAYRAEVEQFRIESAQRLAANEREIERVKENVKSSKKEVKAEYKNELAVLEQRNAELKKKLEDYKDDDMNNWQTFKAEFSDDMNQLGQAFGDFTRSE